MRFRKLRHGASKRMLYAFGYLRAPIVYRWAGARVAGSALIIGRAPHFSIRGEFIAARDFRVRGRILRPSFDVAAGATLQIGDHVFINQGTVIAVAQQVTIGNRVDIGDLVRIYDSNFHPVRPGGRVKAAPVVIEDDVWIASGATILPGVHIGRGSVIGAGAVVGSSVPRGSLVVGNPARVTATFDVPDDFRRRGPQMAVPRRGAGSSIRPR